MNTDIPHGLDAKVQGHIGTQILKTLDVYRTSVRIFSGNCFQLRNLIQVLEDPANAKEMDYEQQSRQHVKNLLEEVIRYFHNFLTSVTTLVEHTRNLMGTEKRVGKSFIKIEHRNEHLAKVKTVFATDPLTQFVQDFRDYMSHYEIPLVDITTRHNSHPPELNVDLDYLDENQWKGWSPTSRKFIDANKPKIRMLKLVDDYEQKVRTFHEEFLQSFERHYDREVNEACALIEEYLKLKPATPT